jgi:hypothetical protein
MVVSSHSEIFDSLRRTTAVCRPHPKSERFDNGLKKYLRYVDARVGGKRS